MGSFTDHSANERTFLAWLRTGIAVVAFGFVVEKFNLFITALGSTNSELGNMIRLDRLTGPLGHYEGFALMVAGIILILTGCFRFVRNERIIDSPNAAGSLGVRVELTVTAVLVLLVAAYCIAILIR
ncbi:MAG: YidH family protein [Rhodomicrobium sp.]